MAFPDILGFLKQRVDELQNPTPAQSAPIQGSVAGQLLGGIKLPQIQLPNLGGLLPDDEEAMRAAGLNPDDPVHRQIWQSGGRAQTPAPAAAPSGPAISLPSFLSGPQADPDPLHQKGLQIPQLPTSTGNLSGPFGDPDPLHAPQIASQVGATLKGDPDPVHAGTLGAPLGQLINQADPLDAIMGKSSAAGLPAQPNVLQQLMQMVGAGSSAVSAINALNQAQQGGSLVNPSAPNPLLDYFLSNGLVGKTTGIGNANAFGGGQGMIPAELAGVPGQMPQIPSQLSSAGQKVAGGAVGALNSPLGQAATTGGLGIGSLQPGAANTAAQTAGTAATAAGVPQGASDASMEVLLAVMNGEALADDQGNTVADFSSLPEGLRLAMAQGILGYFGANPAQAGGMTPGVAGSNDSQMAQSILETIQGMDPDVAYSNLLEMGLSEQEAQSVLETVNGQGMNPDNFLQPFNPQGDMSQMGDRQAAQGAIKNGTSVGKSAQQINSDLQSLMQPMPKVAANPGIQNLPNAQPGMSQNQNLLMTPQIASQMMSGPIPLAGLQNAGQNASSIMFTQPPPNAGLQDMIPGSSQLNPFAGMDPETMMAIAQLGFNRGGGPGVWTDPMMGMAQGAFQQSQGSVPGLPTSPGALTGAIGQTFQPGNTQLGQGTLPTGSNPMGPIPYDLAGMFPPPTGPGATQMPGVSNLDQIDTILQGVGFGQGSQFNIDQIPPQVLMQLLQLLGLGGQSTGQTNSIVPRLPMG